MTEVTHRYSRRVWRRDLLVSIPIVLVCLLISCVAIFWVGTPAGGFPLALGALCVFLLVRARGFIALRIGADEVVVTNYWRTVVIRRDDVAAIEIGRRNGQTRTCVVTIVLHRRAPVVVSASFETGREVDARHTRRCYDDLNNWLAEPTPPADAHQDQRPRQ